MECAKQGFWSWEYHEHKDILADSTSNHNYAQFAKRQYHKARRRYDEQVIESQLEDYDNRYADGLIYDPLVYRNDTAPLHQWKEHNHKAKIKNIAPNQKYS